jgi:hypothetical protein
MRYTLFITCVTVFRLFPRLSKNFCSRPWLMLDCGGLRPFEAEASGEHRGCTFFCHIVEIVERMQ